MNAIPPYADLLALQVTRLDDRLTIVMPFHDAVVGRPGYLHGGAIAGLLEYAAFTSLTEALGDPEVVMKPITVTVDYMRGGLARDSFARATIERLGKRVANVEAVAWQDDPARPIAAGRINFLLER